MCRHHQSVSSFNKEVWSTHLSTITATDSINMGNYQKKFRVFEHFRSSQCLKNQGIIQANSLDNVDLNKMKLLVMDNMASIMHVVDLMQQTRDGLGMDCLR